MDKNFQDKKAIDIYRDIEMPLVPILSNIERTGVLIDSKKLSNLSKQLDKDLKKYKKNVSKLQEKNLI